MGVQEAIGRTGAGNKCLAGGWWTLPAAHPLHQTAAGWILSSARQGDAQKNRQFLATFAIYLVKQFRAEEDELLRVGAPELARCRDENHQLAMRLRELMANVELDLDVAADIRAFLGDWYAHRERRFSWTLGG